MYSKIKLVLRCLTKSIVIPGKIYNLKKVLERVLDISKADIISN